MEKIKITIEIKNKNDQYFYEGIATLNKDIISYSEDETTTIYDKKINRLIKKDKEKKILIDFKNKNMTINIDNNVLTIDIDLIELYSSEELIKAVYKIDEDIIEMIIRINKVLD